MPDHVHPTPDAQRVACEVCLKEVPKSEATVAEAADYVAYFCGLDCYQTWQAQARATGDVPKASPP
ncbi:MAG: DUF3330 domain-containing protein [Burkholderiaceae bacterium]|jgi:hypothetical protein|nr:DUF3330 domain-containing protein [Burkholderiaceae bacterium]MCU0929762.1 DUF3330 domain-containing protein [Burkholderiaceae bacterium]